MNPVDHRTTKSPGMTASQAERARDPTAGRVLPAATSCRNFVGTILSGAIIFGRSPHGRWRRSLANELILVVEDNEQSRKLVRDVLKFKGYEIIEAETGEDGVRLAQERRPSLVLMDIRLPGMDGIEALGRLRAEA